MKGLSQEAAKTMNILNVAQLGGMHYLRAESLKINGKFF